MDVALVESLIGAIPGEQLEGLAKHPLIANRWGAKAQLTSRQLEAQLLIRGPATHIMLFGGARSGKTFLIVKEIVNRALMEPGSRHAILRFRFNHVITSIAKDTLPKVMELCYPAVEWNLDKSLWYVTLPNGSEIWFGGLDEKERTEKILGQEYNSMFLNECSQIGLSARDIALTRLAQKTNLTNKMFYDCNPTAKSHWTYLMFIDKIHPARHQPLVDPDNYDSLLMNPEHNRVNLTKQYIKELENLDERKRRRFLLGLFSDEEENQLWTPEMLDNGRIVGEDAENDIPDMQRVYIAIDPSGCSGPEDLRSDEVGIVVCGLGIDGRGYVLEDLSGRFGPDKWKTIAASAYDRYHADAIVAEVNYGGAMVREVIKTAESESGYPINFREVHATRGKVVRAEPIASLFSDGKISLVGRFTELEYQLCALTTAGYRGDRSPDRADAMIWGLRAIFPAVARETRQKRSTMPKVHLGYSKAKGRYRR